MMKYAILTNLLTWIAAVSCFASDLLMNFVDADNELQEIIAQPQHEGQYNLVLSEALWHSEQPIKILLKDHDNVLVGITRRNADEPLGIYALHEGMIEASERQFNLLPKPIHLHLYAHDKQSYGDLYIKTDGHISIYSGLYDRVQVQARQIFLGKDRRRETQDLIVKNNLELLADELVATRVPVSVGGATVISTHRLKTRATLKTKRGGGIAAQIIEQHGQIIFGNDAIVGGRKTLKFERLNLKAKLASSGNLVVRGNELVINKEGEVFAKASARLYVDKLEVHGKINAPRTQIVCDASAQWNNSRLYAKSFSLTAFAMTFASGALFDVTEGMWFKGGSASGSGQFIVGGHKNWKFPIPKSARNRSSAERASESNSILGMYWDVTSIDLDHKTQFKMATGKTVINATYAKINGKIISGTYNKFPFSITAEKYFSLEGITSAVEAQMKSLQGSIAGICTVDKLTAVVDSLKIPGVVKASSLSTTGRSLVIPESGSVTSSHYVMAHSNLSVAGSLHAGLIEGQLQNLSVEKSGRSFVGTAKLDVEHTRIEGDTVFGNLDLSGNSLSVSGRLRAGSTYAHIDGMTIEHKGQVSLEHAQLNVGRTYINGDASFGNTSIEGTSLYLSSSGRLVANTITNHVPKWELLGSGSIETLDAKLPQFSFRSAKDMRITRANLETNELALSGHLKVDDATIVSDKWTLAQDAVIDGRVNVNVHNATLRGTVEGEYITGVIKDLSLSPSAQLKSSLTKIAGEHFKSDGAINAQRGVDLDYQVYESWGTFNTGGQLAFRINDRVVDDNLLLLMQQLFRFNSLSIHTDQQFLRFLNDFYFDHGLALSAPSIEFFNPQNHDVRERKHFGVNGSLVLDARSGDLSIDRFSVSAHNLSAHSSGRFRVHNSSVTTAHHQIVKADGGIVVTPEVIEHEVVKKKSRYFGLRRKVITHRWNEVLPSEFISGGFILFDGLTADFNSTQFHAGTGVQVSSPHGITNKERLLYDLVIIRKRTPWSRSSRHQQQESDAPTVFRDQRLINLESKHGMIQLPNTIIAAKHVKVTGKKGVYLCLPSLKRKISQKSSGVFLCYSLSGLASDPRKTLRSFDPLIASVSSIFAAKDNPVNAASAAIMTGIEAHNLLENFDLKSRFLSNLLTIRACISRTAFEFEETSPGHGGLFAEVAEIRSDEGDIKTLNGYRLVVDELTISCPQGDWIREGFKHELRMSSESESVSVGFNPLVMEITDVKMSTQSSDYERIHWQPQPIKCDRLTVNAKNIVDKDGPEVLNFSRSGFDVSIAQNGGSFNMISDDFAIGASFRAPDAKKNTMGFIGLSVNGTNLVLPLRASSTGSLSPPQAKGAHDAHENMREQFVTYDDSWEIDPAEDFAPSLVAREPKEPEVQPQGLDVEKTKIPSDLSHNPRSENFVFRPGKDATIILTAHAENARPKEYGFPLGDDDSSSLKDRFLPKTCSEYGATQCVVAKPQSNAVCKIQPNGDCGDMIVSDYYRKNDDTFMSKKYFVMPKEELSRRPEIPCLERTSPYFDSADMVNQAFVDMAEILHEPRRYYRWGNRKWEEKRVDVEPIFIPICPMEHIPDTFSLLDRETIGDLCKSNRDYVYPKGNNKIQDRSANGPGLRLYGLGLNASTTWNNSIAFAAEDINKIFLLEIEAPAGTLILDPSNEEVRERMKALDLDEKDIARCSPPVIHVLSEKWVVLKDPTGMTAKESRLEHIEIPEGTTFLDEIRYYHPVVENYLKTRMKDQ